jgi:hypothetical protein
VKSKVEGTCAEVVFEAANKLKKKERKKAFGGIGTTVAMAMGEGGG